MNNKNDSEFSKSIPVAIGGVGGSGTRLVSTFLRQLGYYLGGDLNDEGDNLWFSLLFRRRSVLSESFEDVGLLYHIFRRRMQGLLPQNEMELALLESLCERSRLHHDESWLRDRKASFCTFETSALPTTQRERWGWKEPNTHVLLERLLDFEPKLKYIHVIRSGLDMAFSSNQNQVQLWGKALFNLDSIDSPAQSLKYWCESHRRVLKVAKAHPDNFLLLDYDALCRKPAVTLVKLYAFLDFNPSKEQIFANLNFIEPSKSEGRFRAHDLSAFDQADLDYVAELGYVTA